MKTSITSQSNNIKSRTFSKAKVIIYKISAIAFWILIWEALALRIGSELILASPVSVAKTLFGMIGRGELWKPVWFSLARIFTGFAAALVLGSAAAVVSSRVRAVKILLSPITSVIKSTPVASFIILAIIWFGSRNLNAFISFLMGFPIVYLNILSGIESVSRELLEMSEVYGMNLRKKLTYVYLPQLMPFVTSACSVALGLCWKSGVASEVIGISVGSIGERLYESKLYFMTSELLAWTVVIIVISTVIEKLVLAALGAASRAPSRRFSMGNLSRYPAASDIDAAAGGITISDLHKSFGEESVLKGVSIAVAPGEHVALMGQSGAGKTTLSRIILGLETQDSGKVELTGQGKIGAVFQEDRLIGGLNSIGNIVAAGGSASSAYSLLQDFRFTDELIFKPCSELSGGEKRRVAIARALICGGGILIFDEPFKGIDNETLSEAVLPKVKELSDSKTLLLITHSRAEAEELCSRTEKMEE